MNNKQNKLEEWRWEKAAVLSFGILFILSASGFRHVFLISEQMGFGCGSGGSFPETASLVFLKSIHIDHKYREKHQPVFYSDIGDFRLTLWDLNYDLSDTHQDSHQDIHQVMTIPDKPNSRDQRYYSK